MTWNPLQLRGLSFHSPLKDPAYIEFQSGLNVICGASDTGKSFIVEAIDFLLGASNRKPLRDIPERIGYDSSRLVLEATDSIFTLQRSTSGGNFRKLESNYLVDSSDSEGTTLKQKHSHGDYSTLSTYLLSLIDLAEKYVLYSTRQGTTRSLSFRNLTRLVVVQEDDIIKRGSPILSGQRNDKTIDYSIFKLLLTGLDDRELVEQAAILDEQNAIIKNNRVKVELINELIQELEYELREVDIDRSQAIALLSDIQERVNRQQLVLNQVQSDFDTLANSRREIINQKENILYRTNEITSLLSRFDLLKRHYQVDLERLESIQESGSVFVHLERIPCPLCGASPDNQHLSEECDGDVENVVHAAIAEIQKIEQLSIELDQTIQDLQNETEELNTQQQNFDIELQTANQEIQAITSPLRDAQGSFSELIGHLNEVQRIIDVFARIDQLHQKRDSLPVEEEVSNEVIDTQVDLSTSVLHDFAQTVQNLLQSWGFPGADSVYFDDRSKDIIIGGQPRSSSGKGLRAVTHAAVSIGLMDFCKERDLSHPGFVVLDSPLLAYWKPEASEDRAILEGINLKTRFYEYLADNYNDEQIIIIENEHPPSDIEERISMTVFTKNPNEGRYGFFPPVT